MPFQNDSARVPVLCLLTVRGRPVCEHAGASQIHSRSSQDIYQIGVGRGLSLGCSCPWMVVDASRWGMAAEVQQTPSLPKYQNLLKYKLTSVLFNQLSAISFHGLWEQLCSKPHYCL